MSGYRSLEAMVCWSGIPGCPETLMFVFPIVALIATLGVMGSTGIRNLFLPAGTTLTELVAEARADRPLLRRIGWRDSAVFHPNVIKHQYERAAHFLGYLGIGPYVLAGLVLVLACLVIAGVFHGFWTWERIVPNQSRMAELPRWLGLAVGFGCGVPFGLTAMGSVLSTLRWNTVYAEGLVIQSSPDGGPGGGKNLLLEPFQRLVFADQQIGRFRGDESDGGFARAKRIVMETDRSIPDSLSPVEFYDAAPSGSTFVGNHAAIIKALVSDSVEAGKAGRVYKDPPKKKGLERLDPVGNGGIMLGVILVLLTVAMQCVGVDTGALVQGAMENLPYTE